MGILSLIVGSKVKMIAIGAVVAVLAVAGLAFAKLSGDLRLARTERDQARVELKTVTGQRDDALQALQVTVANMAEAHRLAEQREKERAEADEQVENLRAEIRSAPPAWRDMRVPSSVVRVCGFYSGPGCRP